MIDKLNKFVFDKRVVAVFLAVFLAIVCFLIFIVPLYSKPVVPQPTAWSHEAATSELQGVWIVEGQRPSQLTDEVVQKGIQYIQNETGWNVPEVKTGPAPLSACSSWDAEGWTDNPSNVPCKRGWILVLQDDRLLAGAPSSALTHGRTFLPDVDKDGRPDFPTDWATIVLTDGSLELDSSTSDCRLPSHAYTNLWTHELLHGLGYGHTYTRIIPGVDAVVMERTGHILNDNLCDGGWNGAGLDTWNPDRKSFYESGSESP